MKTKGIFFIAILFLLGSCNHGELSSVSESNQHFYDLKVNYYLENGLLGEQVVTGIYPPFEEARCTEDSVQIPIVLQDGKVTSLVEELDEENSFALASAHIVNQLELDSNAEKSTGYAIVHYQIFSDTSDKALFNSANALYQEGDYKNSEEVLDGLSISSAQIPCVLYLKSKIVTQYEQYQSAVDYLNQALEAAPQNDSFYYARAYRLDKINRQEEAIQDLQKAIQIDPKTWEIYHLLHQIYYEQEKYLQSIHYSTLGLKYREDYYFYNKRAWSYLYNKNYQLATEDFYKALELNPEHINSYDGMVDLFIKMKEFNLAMSPLEKSLQMGGVEPHRLHYLAEIADGLGNLEEAEGYYQEIINEYDPAGINYNNLGWFYLKHRQYLKAIETFRAGLSHFPEYTFILNNLGTAYFFNEEYQKSIDAHQKVIDVNFGSINTFSRAGIARAQIKLGELDKALVHLEFVAENDPYYVDTLYEYYHEEGSYFLTILDEFRTVAKHSKQDQLIQRIEKIQEEIK